MKDEIKEIIDELKECNDYDISPVLLQSNEVIILLDYITNLQEENNKLRIMLIDSIETTNKAIEIIDKELQGDDKDE